MVSEEVIEEQIDKALEAKEKAEGMGAAYARGVREALGWVIEEVDDPPFDDDE